MNIRKFKKSDAERISEIIWAALDINNSKDYGSDVLHFMKKEYTSEHIRALSQKRTFLVAEDVGGIIGVGGLEGGHICSVFVDPSYQGKGAGSLIMQKLEFLAKKKSSSVFLHSSLTAKSFYNKIGYSDKEHVADPVFGDSILMQKIL
jgi:N-acetylglutamate synthase-like GNAT family acetyltransferase